MPGSREASEIQVAFVFAPHGAPPPTEWMAQHPDWVKVSATFHPHQTKADGFDAAARDAPLPGSPAPEPPAATGAPSTAGRPARPGRAPDPGSKAETTDDPVSAYLKVNAAMQTPPDHSG